MGHSLGDAVMLQAEPHFSPQPSGVIVADAFSSLKDFWAARGTSRLLLRAVPDVWDNVAAIRKVHAPVLVVHSDTDAMTSLDGGRRVYAAANPPKQLAVLHGFKHNGVRRHTSETWWAPVFAFVGSPGTSRTPFLPIPAEKPAPSASAALDAERARENALRDGAAMLQPTPSSTLPASPASGPRAPRP